MQVELSDVAGVASVKRVERSADHESRIENHKEDEALRKRNADAVAAGVCVRAWGVSHAVCLCKHAAVVCGRWQASLHTVTAPRLCGCCRRISNKPIQFTQSTHRSQIQVIWVDTCAICVTLCPNLGCNLALCPAGKPMEYFYRHLYLPQLGMFKALPADLNLGSFAEQPAKPVALGYAEDGGFIKDGVEYK